MKITTFILITVILQVSASTFAQKITLSEKNVPLINVLEKIRLQSGYDFMFSTKVLADANTVTINVKNTELKEALELIFKSQPLTYKIEAQSVSISKKVPSFLERLADRWNAVDLRGVILDEKGQPLSGASVKVKGTSKSVTTNNKGEFYLQGVNENAVLLISYIGYQTKEIAASSNLSEIKLALSLSKLDEVQVIAYGTTTQRYNVGSVSKVTAEEIAQQPVGNVLQALAGRVPGLTVNQTSGLPGASLKLQIRGQNSLRPSTNGIAPFDQPLFIIDGVPFSANNSNINLMPSIASPVAQFYGNPYGGMSPFNTIDPSQIESIEVLRDADATSIYGSRGANGVILITTKKGSAGKIKLNTNITTGQSNVTRTVDMMNTQEYVAMRKEAMKNGGVIPTIANSPDILVFDTAKYTDWKKFFLGNTAKTVDGSTSISGGSMNTQFLIGVGYHRETYILPGDFSDNRFSLNSNVHHQTTDKKLSLDLSANYSYGRNNSSGSASSLEAFQLLPNYPDLTDEKGNLIWSYKGITLDRNPIQYLKQKYSLSTYSLMSNMQIGYRITPELNISSSFGYNSLNSLENSTIPISAQNPAFNPQGSSSFGNNDYKTWIIEPRAEFIKQIIQGKLSVIVGGTFQKNTNISNFISASGYTNDALLGSPSGATEISLTGSGNFTYKYSAMFARVNYLWDKKYILNLTGRRDGSSRFGPGKQFGNFGSVGAGWILTEEPMIKKLLPFMSYGKLRISYGTTGSDAIGDYQYLPNWIPSSTEIKYQGAIGYRPINLFNDEYSWATTKKLETGLELGFINDKFLLNVSWYKNRSVNQLVSYSLPDQTGFNSVTQNFPAIVENKGWEIIASTLNIKTRNFSWQTILNLSIPKNKLVSFPGIESSSYSTVYIVGEPLSVIRAFSYIGVDPLTGVFQYNSKSGPTSNPDYLLDFSAIGNLDPKYYGGLSNNFSYGKFQFNFFLDFRKQLGINYLQSIYSQTVGARGYNQPSIVLNRWQKPGDNTEITQINSNRNSPASRAARHLTSSDAIYSDASFIRVKTVSLSYLLNNEFLKRNKIESLKLFINAQNLFTITNYKGTDPETQNYFGVPPLRTIVAGVQFNF